MQLITRQTNNLGHTNTVFKEPEIEVKKKSGANSQRAEIISRFVKEINKERIGTKFPIIKKGSGSLKKLCILINQHPMLKTNWQLEQFYGTCKHAKSFSACCYGTLKVKQ